MDVRIGIKNTPKELEVLLAEDTDGDAVREHIDKALADGATLWLTDRRGRQYGVPVESLGFHLDDGTYLVEAGTIQVFVGGSSLADPVGEAEILKTFRIPPMERRASASTSVAQ